MGSLRAYIAIIILLLGAPSLAKFDEHTTEVYAPIATWKSDADIIQIFMNPGLRDDGLEDALTEFINKIDLEIHLERGRFKVSGAQVADKFFPRIGEQMAERLRRLILWRMNNLTDNPLDEHGQRLETEFKKIALLAYVLAKTSQPYEIERKLGAKNAGIELLEELMKSPNSTIRKLAATSMAMIEAPGKSQICGDVLAIP